MTAQEPNLKAMAPLKNQLRRVRDKWFEAAVRDTAAATAAEVAPEFAELRRILGDQGDAADQVAETLGRMLARLSGELSTLAGEVSRLHDRLDGIEALR
jgi:hypothetical protein